MPVSATSMTSRALACTEMAAFIVFLLSVTAVPLGAQETAENGATGKAWLTGGLGTGTEGIAAVSAGLGVLR